MSQREQMISARIGNIVDYGQTSEQEILEVARIVGGVDGELGLEAEPLKFILWLGNFMVCSEVFCRQALESYQAGYAGSGSDVSSLVGR